MIAGFLIYEWILMIIGAVMAFSVIYLVVRSVVRKEPVSVVLMIVMLAASLVMIGFPAIQSIEFGKNNLIIKKATRDLQANPQDTTAQKKLVAAMDNFDTRRAEKSAEALNTIAQAHEATGDYENAASYAQKALSLDSKSVEAKKTWTANQQNVKLQRAVEEKTKVLEQDLAQAKTQPNNTKVLQRIEQTVAEIKEQPIRINDAALLVVAKAAAVVNESETALKISEAVSQSSHGKTQKEATQLRREIKETKRQNAVKSPAKISIDSQAIIKLLPKFGL
ncbi:MAG: hypothetical protein RL757_1351 [Bacteroidota bacterium]|jgi:tetratricopeptide (TPR) repeat protein